MKKVLSVILCAALLLTLACAAGFSAGAASTLTVTDDSGNKVTVTEGQDVLYTLYLYAGTEKILNGQGIISYPSDQLSVDLYGDISVNKSGEIEIDPDPYSFPLVYKSSLIANPDIAGKVFFNFSAAKGIAKFDKDNCVLLKYRFKATGTGSASINTFMEYMINENNDKIFSNGEVNTAINPYTRATLEAASGIIGDVDGDWGVTIKDATLIQKILSGSSDKYVLSRADADQDKALTLKDAIGIRKYLVKNVGVGTPNIYVGTALFTSES